jgi:predicted MPP superfamily phosphohydrolase
MHRRTFLKAAIAIAVPATPVAAASYGLYEAGAVKVERQTIALPRLPAAFDGLRLAFLTDIHHGPYVHLDYVASLVRTTDALSPDLVVLGGDYSSKEAKYIAPCFDVLSGLTAPLGVYGVRGNHEYLHGLTESVEGFRTSRIAELTNTGVWLERGGSRFRLAGIDDLWYGKPDLGAALGNATSTDACLLLSHNPDFAETLKDPRVGMILSGHTHGGQVYVPGFGAPIVPSRYGQKYLKGLVEAPMTQVYISRGLGTVAPPVRYNSRPELTLITLRAA